VPLEPAKRDRIRNSVSFDNIPEYGNIDITLKERTTIPDRDWLRNFYSVN